MPPTQISALSPESVSLYKYELHKAYKQIAFELLLVILLLIAINMINHHFLFLIEFIVMIKLFISCDNLHLLKTGKITYLKLSEWDNIK